MRKHWRRNSCGLLQEVSTAPPKMVISWRKSRTKRSFGGSLSCSITGEERDSWISREILGLRCFFALEAFCQKVNGDHRKNGLLIYCFPCKDLRRPYDDEINKSPFRYKSGSTLERIDMDLAIGCQIGFEWMKEHQPTFEKRYSSPEQAFGWDRAYHPNPRLSFQKGMLVYPYKTENISIERNGPSWLTQCLRMNASDPFHLGSAKDELPPLRIRISHKSVCPLLEYVQDVFGLTPGNVYLDCGRDRLRIES